MNAFTSFMKGLFDDPDWTEDEPEALANNVVAELLPYRVYDPESELYYNENSTGFIIEVNPVVGSDEVAGNLQSVINSNAPNTATVQFINWGSGQNMGVMRRVFCLRRSADHRELRPL